MSNIMNEIESDEYVTEEPRASEVEMSTADSLITIARALSGIDDTLKIMLRMKPLNKKEKGE